MHYPADSGHAIPIGGALLSVTWGTVHILTQGSMIAGLAVMVFALVYGCVYLAVRRHALTAYCFMALAFIV